jgi:hypothetical protein
MKANEIIRDLLNLIDKMATQETDVDTPDEPTATVTIVPGQEQGDEMDRFKQVVDLITSPEKQYSTRPDEKYADIDAVTTLAGGGLNGPKHPDDLRGNSVKIYGGN